MTRDEYRKKEKTLNKTAKVLKKTLIIILSGYLVLCLFIHFFLERVICPSHQGTEDIPVFAGQENRLENIEFKMNDGIILRGWLLKNSQAEKSNLLIYFGGNDQELSRIIPKMATIDGWSVALINRRGLGGSEGFSSEPTLYGDSLAIYDYFAGRDDINRENIAVMGWSLGSGVATYMAENRKTSSVILVSPYDSLVSVIQEKCPVIPVDFLFEHKYDSISRAGSITAPLLIVAGSNDKLIPVWHSARFREAWGGKVAYEVLPGKNHHTLVKSEEYWQKIREFLAEQN